MPSFLYFVPTAKQQLDRADMAAIGLGGVMHPRGVCCAACTGPGGATGVLAIADLPGRSRHGYDQAKQIWRAGPGGKWHVGMWLDQRPGPDDLLREELYPGQAVELADGQLWTIPRCLGILPEREGTLPFKVDVAEDGTTIVARTVDRYTQLCAAAFDYWLVFSRAQNAPKLTIASLTELALAALAVNYRIGRIEALGLLGLLEESHIIRVCRATIDADEVEAYFAAKARDAAPAVDDQKKSAGPT